MSQIEMTLVFIELNVFTSREVSFLYVSVLNQKLVRQ